MIVRIALATRQIAKKLLRWAQVPRRRGEFRPENRLTTPRTAAILRALDSVNVAGVRKSGSCYRPVGIGKMRGLKKPLKCSPWLFLLMLPACQSLEGRWPWPAPVKVETVTVTEPPRASAPQELPMPKKSQFASEPQQFQVPAAEAEPPSVALGTPEKEQVEKREIPVDATATVREAPAAPTRTDPVPLPVPVQDPLTAAMQFYRDGRPDEAVKILGVYDPKDQEVLLCLLPLLAQFGRNGSWSERMNAEQALVIVHQMRSLLRDLQRRVPLQIDCAVFCHSLQGYGQPDRVATNVFRPGDPVRIYVEVQNLTDRQIRNNQYAVNLSATLEIQSADGKLVWEPKVKEGTPSISQSPRMDHFTLINFSIPRNLAPGTYTLDVTVTDQDTHRHARKSLQFRVAGVTASQ
jgi:hypothetical protein